jgi:hypothetical protein
MNRVRFSRHQPHNQTLPAGLTGHVRPVCGTRRQRPGRGVETAGFVGPDARRVAVRRDHSGGTRRHAQVADSSLGITCSRATVRSARGHASLQSSRPQGPPPPSSTMTSARDAEVKPHRASVYIQGPYTRSVVTGAITAPTPHPGAQQIQVVLNWFRELKARAQMK